MTTNRRGFFGTFAAAMGWLIGRSAAGEIPTYTVMKVSEPSDSMLLLNQHGKHVSYVPVGEYAYASAAATPMLVGKVQILLDGKDVTKGCREANAREGWARVICKDLKGNPVIDWVNREVTTTLLYGDVRIVRKEGC